MKGFSLLVTIAVSAGYAHGAGATLRASVETMLDSTSSCNPNQESFLVCLDGSTGTAWNSCGPKNGRKYCPKGYAMCGDGSCFRKSSQCFRRGRGGLEYGKSVCAAEPTCNPNHLDVLVCSDGSKGKGASDWNACGRNWKKSGSRKYCPRGFYQCDNGFCPKNKNGCRGSPLKFKPCAPAFTCPKNSFQKTRAAFPQSFDDCECNPGFRKGSILDGPVCYPITPGSCFCSRVYDPVCAGGKTYSNQCEAECAFAPKPYSEGKCPKKSPPTNPGTCFCTREFDPVCAGGKTYSNQCEAECAGVLSFTKGKCSKKPECFCTREFDPVCAGGKTYSNQCEAECAGEVAFTKGKCSKKTESECFCTREFDPVCAGGKTYSNKCEAECAGAHSFVKGSCTSVACNPNSENRLVCANGSKGKRANDWNACGRNWKTSGSRKYCPRGFYQCENGFCSKNKSACKGSPLKFKPCSS